MSHDCHIRWCGDVSWGENENFENRKFRFSWDRFADVFFESAILRENVIWGDVSWGENDNFEISKIFDFVENRLADFFLKLRFCETARLRNCETAILRKYYNRVMLKCIIIIRSSLKESNSSIIVCSLCHGLSAALAALTRSFLACRSMRTCFTCIDF